MKRFGLLVLCCLPILVFANNDARYQTQLKQIENITGYQFSKYSTPVYKGKKAPLKKDEFVHAFRTRIGEAHKDGTIDFAGKYIMVGWGCGTQCNTGAMIDKSTGKVYDTLSTTGGIIDDENIHPNKTCEQLTEGITGDAEKIYKKDSRLMVVKVTCNAWHDIDTPQESATVIYHVLEWQEKTKSYKWLADKVTRVPASQLYDE